jgi:OFA family oxalate/formate antiporter-like MFS transporter
VVFVVLVAVCSRLVRTAPQRRRPEARTPSSGVTVDGSMFDRDWKAMMRSADFYLLALLFVCGTLSGMMVVGQASPIAQATLGISPESAGLIVSVLALGMVGGKLGWAVLSDKVGRTPVFVAMLVVAAIASLVLAGTSVYLAVVLAIMTVGLCYGGFLSLMGPVTAEGFGHKYLGVNFGIMFFTIAISAFAGPRLAALVAEANDGDYSKAFLIAAGINVAGLVLLAGRRLLHRRVVVPTGPESG